MTEKRSWYGWVELIAGISLVVLGIYTFCNPETAVSGIVVFYGLAAIISGIADIALYVKLERRTGFDPITALVGGILSIFVGILLLMNIGAGVYTFSILFPIWFIVHCITRLANLGFVRRFAGNVSYWISLIINVIGLIVGFMLLLNPFASALSLAYCAGLYLLLSGIGSIVTGIGRLRAEK
ncbi:MAG: HdeD family acid-resistance protein [Oscillospiraceae bacterium]